MREVSESMIIDAVDEADQVIGQVERRAIFAAKTNFRVVHVFVFDGQGHLLLQKIPGQARRHPSFWGSSVAGYVFSGEEYEGAAQRRLEQELGVTGAVLRFVGKTTMLDEGCRKFISLYTTQHLGPFDADQTLIEELASFSVPTVGTMIEKGERQFTPTFLHLFAFFTTSEQSATTVTA